MYCSLIFGIGLVYIVWKKRRPVGHSFSSQVLVWVGVLDVGVDDPVLEGVHDEGEELWVLGCHARATAT